MPAWDGMPEVTQDYLNRCYDARKAYWKRIAIYHDPLSLYADDSPVMWDPPSGTDYQEKNLEYKRRYNLDD